MRVLHFFKTYYPDTTGGIEQVMFQLSQGCRSLGVDGQVLTLSPNPVPERIQVADHEVVRVKENFNLASTGFSLTVFKRFKDMAAEADLVHFHFPWPMMDLVHFATRHGRPTVLSYHSDIIKQRTLLKFYAPLMNRMLGSMDRILVASPNYQRSSETLKPFADKTVVVPYGLDEAAYPQVSAQCQARWQAQLPEKFFLFVGVLRYYKGLHTLLDALEGADYPVLLLGGGPQEQELRAQAERLGLRNLRFLGRLDDEDKACLLQRCHALVFPSHLRSEAFGISLLEAAMYGKPMISCEIGTGTTFVNIDGETGLAVPPENPPALREAMRRLWDEPGLAARFGAQARARFEKVFTAERMCAATVQVYKELLVPGAVPVRADL
ncbi:MULTISPECIES: glycosyltransferase family 4 protein [Pseudomonas]|uniref:glycosyltransferase family 4 protein n=1 Tax=Pseudomonas TaxID=286 RepID=UPI0018A5B8CE|nr:MULTISPECIES: glycosyltransferase family 4 protein [Pseudomonas]EKV0214880.1 glycosyltransferase family 4 protein [Pseudomonas aeruginosa]EKX5072003.1 glycosyltransferase family 4 protein [Pseudomonas aeruginosa]EKX8762984.1 glycosyltransferase family 4 protein [Pseudomonas aeruginosa]MEB3881602.1 glycosyltransferase family 4 protein [Pseudomonas guariconensis]MEB3898036.1 glycosyltransferase family 4 protein [Pseudomonas guariconensis]